MKLRIEVIHHSGAKHFYARLPYALVKTGGPLHPDTPQAHYNKHGDLRGPYTPGLYFLLPVGMIGQGPLLGEGISARLLHTDASTGFSIWLVGTKLPSTDIDVSEILKVVRGLASWVQQGGEGEWRNKLDEAEAAAAALGFDGVEVVEYSTYQEWETRLKSDIR